MLDAGPDELAGLHLELGKARAEVERRRQQAGERAGEAMTSGNGHDDAWARAEAANLERMAELEAQLEETRARLVAVETARQLRKVEPVRSTMTDKQKAEFLRRQREFFGKSSEEAMRAYFAIPWK